MGRKTIKWLKCRRKTTVAYKERLTLGYEKLKTSIGTVEEERKSFKDAFVRVAEEMCVSTSVRGSPSKRKNQTWLTEVGKAIGENSDQGE